MDSGQAVAGRAVVWAFGGGGLSRLHCVQEERAVRAGKL